MTTRFINLIRKHRRQIYGLFGEQDYNSLNMTNIDSLQISVSLEYITHFYFYFCNSL